MINNLIYDIGMHNGDDTAYYLSLEYDVIAIEASPELVQLAKQRFNSAIENKKLQILNIGIGDGEGFMDFYLNKKNSVWNSFDKKIGTREGADYELIKIKTTNIQQIITERGIPYYMKIDIEGHDIICLNSLMNCPIKPKFISAEVNDFDILLKLKDLGYLKFKLIDQNCFLPLQLPSTKEYKIYKKHKAFKISMNFFIRIIRKLFGNFINKYFEKKYKYYSKQDHPHGSSGPFGKNLPGIWLNFKEITIIYHSYKEIHEKSKSNTGYNFWVDVHATT